MRVLLDHNVPRPLISRLPGHEVHAARDNGWSELDNGELLDQAENAGYEAFITGDKNIPDQQNLSGRTIRIVILSQKAWPVVARNIEAIEQALNDAETPRLAHLELA